ncbi:hypothetical protein AWENTII_005088 [Aspergillus wentii]|nr:hypothetical protein MW887_008848 [Aspergillus wentii]
MCAQCIKRENLLECVNSNDKKPEHLNVLTIKSTTAGSRGVVPSRRAIQPQKSSNVDVPQYRNPKTNIQLSSETHVQAHGETGGSGCIDPKLLHFKSPDYGIEPDASTRELQAQTHDDPASVNHSQDSPGNDKQPSPSEQEKRPPKDCSRESSPGGWGSEALSKQPFKNDEEHNIKVIQDNRGSCGFAISSGWSSTFFPTA